MRVSIGVLPTKRTKNSCSITDDETVRREGSRSRSFPKRLGWFGYWLLTYSSRAHWDFSCRLSMWAASDRPQASGRHARRHAQTRRRKTKRKTGVIPVPESSKLRKSHRLTCIFCTQPSTFSSYIWKVNAKYELLKYIYWWNRWWETKRCTFARVTWNPNNGEAAGWQIRWMFYAQNEKLMRNWGKKCL